LAVLVSLVYVSIQIRQTERNQRALINQGAMVAMLPQPEFAAAWVKVVAGEKDYTALEYWHLAVVLRGLLGSLQESLLQKKAGLIGQVTTDYIELGVHFFLSQPVIRAIWSNSRASFPAETVVLVDGLIARLPLATPVDLGQLLKAQLSQMQH